MHKYIILMVNNEKIYIAAFILILQILFLLVFFIYAFIYLAFFCGVGTAGVWWGLSVGLIMAATLLGSRAWKMTSFSNWRGRNN